MPRLAGRIAAERPDVASALAALEGPVRHYADYAGLVVRRAPERGERLPLEESEGEAFRSVRRADARATELINAKTNAQIGLWTSREIYVRTLVAGTIAVLIGLAVAFRSLLLRARPDAARIEQLAHFDSLTGLPNRSLLDDRLSRLVTMVERDATPLAILLFDLDGFKAVNDAPGPRRGRHAAFRGGTARLGMRSRVGYRGTAGRRRVPGPACPPPTARAPARWR